MLALDFSPWNTAGLKKGSNCICHADGPAQKKGPMDIIFAERVYSIRCEPAFYTGPVRLGCADIKKLPVRYTVKPFVQVFFEQDVHFMVHRIKKEYIRRFAAGSQFLEN